MVNNNSSLRAFQPRYQKVRRWLEDQLRQNAWKEGEKIPGESVLARNLGVSTITVRQALNALTEEGSLRREKGRGTFVARTTSRRPETTVDATVGGAADEDRGHVLAGRCVAILVPAEINNSGGISERKRPIVEALERGISQRGGRTMVLLCSSEDRKNADWLRRAGEANGLVLFEYEGLEFGERLLPLAADLNVPLVTCDYMGMHPASRVVEDHGWGMFLAVEHLRTLGHRRIALAEFQWKGFQPGEMAWVANRSHAFAAACRRFQMESGHDDILIPDMPGFLEDQQVEAGRCLGAQLLEPKSPYTAVIGINDFLALGILEEVRRHGSPLSVVGFDNIPEAGFQNLTTLAPPYAMMGDAVVELLESQILNPVMRTDRYLQVVVRPHLICRESSRAIVS